jgi:biopolymer transport protein ExbD
MAEINPKAGGNGRGGTIRSKKMSTKIDMTPMVDLAFLLLTFFMLANTFLDPKVMDIVMPEKDSTDKTSPVNINDVLTLTLWENNQVYYALGNEKPKLTNYEANGLRKVVLDALTRNPRKLYVFIKPTNKSKYHNLVDTFDEMGYLKVPRYTLVDVTEDDLRFIEIASK